MTLVASLVIDAPTDTLVRSEGFDAASFFTITAGALWRIELDDDSLVAPGVRFLEGTTDNTANLSIQAINPFFANPAIPEARVVIQSVNNATGSLEPIVGTLGNVYLMVFRMFRDPS